MIKKVFKRRVWMRQLRVLKGHRQLKELNAIGRINALKQDLASTPCIKNGTFSKSIFGSEIEQAELITRQFLLARIESTFFAKYILYSVGNSDSAISYPLPLQWRKVVIRHGFKVSEFNSIIRWNVFVMLKFVSTIHSFVLKIFGDLKQLIRKDNPLKGRYVYFDTLSRRNFPLTSSRGPMQNIFTWYLRWSGKTPSFDYLCHDVKGISIDVLENIPVIPIPSALPFLTKMRGSLSLVLWGFKMILFSSMDLIRGHWWHALLFGESFKAKVINIADHDDLAKDYLFHNSGWIYRPLWTYEAERRGSRILFYFYSTNVEGFKQVGGYPNISVGWNSSTWNNFLVWNSEQQDFVIRSIVRKVKTCVVGPIWFESGVEDLPVMPSSYIAVFDVQPFRDAFYKSFGIPFDYYVPENCNQFLEDIYELLSEKDITLVLKRKRSIGKLSHYKYRNVLEHLEKKPNFISLAVDVRAQQIIENCKAVISMPFTSTALIAKQMGKPSVYYDPNSLIQKDDRGAHGIIVLSNKKELEDWLIELINQGH